MAAVTQVIYKNNSYRRFLSKCPFSLFVALKACTLLLGSHVYKCPPTVYLSMGTCFVCVCHRHWYVYAGLYTNVTTSRKRGISYKTCICDMCFQERIDVASRGG